jgi:hypothetical protein
MEKFASNLFSDEERGLIHAMLKGAQVKTASAPRQERPQIVPAMFKEAMEHLSVDEIKDAAKKLAMKMDPAEAEAILKTARYDVSAEQTKQAQLESLGDELGLHMFGGFLKAAEAHFAEEEEEEKTAGIRDRAPSIHAAVNE